ncbi:hypothetical protein [Variovorax sp. UMC13]|uniref:hypothetical protein n=1 Tax=Variovorax sp. UMC13 TaxID=1862326 RepID=UPI0016025A83|nr:hypothetical protein [Variovorax sp. UMC13]MBB1601581.1 hypothetical protein [Variovorax sp. UMC13]
MAVKISGAPAVVVVPATLYLPGENGAFFKHVFSVHFRRLTTSEREATVKDIVDGKVSLRDALDRLVIGWGGMLDEAEQPVVYTHAERRAANEAWDGLEQAMGVAFFDNFAVTQREAALKNSAAPSVAA